MKFKNKFKNKFKYLIHDYDYLSYIQIIIKLIFVKTYFYFIVTNFSSFKLLYIKFTYLNT